MSQTQSTSLWIWAFLFLLLASFVAFILFLDQKIVKSSASESAPKQTEQAENKPKIDFYSILPKREMEISISEKDLDAIINPVLNKDAKGSFVLQVGSFQQSVEADSMKAQLALLGFEAKIESAEVNAETWHRVQLGPFASNTKMSGIKNLLIEHEIDYIQRSLMD